VAVFHEHAFGGRAAFRERRLEALCNRRSELALAAEVGVRKALEVVGGHASVRRRR